MDRHTAGGIQSGQLYIFVFRCQFPLIGGTFHWNVYRSDHIDDHYCFTGVVRNNHLFPKLEKYVQIICMIPYTIQGVILSVSILSLYVGTKSILSNRLVMLMGAYCIVILPYIYQGIRNGMRAVNMLTLIEAAEMLGASKIYAFFRVVVPNIISAIIVSSLLAVGIIFGDYVLIRNLAGTSAPNMQIFLYQTMKSDSTKASAVFVIIMFVTFVITAIVLFLKSREGRGRAQKK